MIQNKITFKKGRPYADRRKDMDVWYVYIDGKKIGNSLAQIVFIYKIYESNFYITYHFNGYRYRYDIHGTRHKSINDAKNTVVKSINANPKNYFQEV